MTEPQFPVPLWGAPPCQRNPPPPGISKTETCPVTKMCDTLLKTRTTATVQVSPSLHSSSTAHQFVQIYRNSPNTISRRGAWGIWGKFQIFHFVTKLTGPETDIWIRLRSTCFIIFRSTRTSAFRLCRVKVSEWGHTVYSIVWGGNVK